MNTSASRRRTKIRTSICNEAVFSELRKDSHTVVLLVLPPSWPLGWGFPQIFVRAQEKSCPKQNIMPPPAAPAMLQAPCVACFASIGGQSQCADHQTASCAKAPSHSIARLDWLPESRESRWSETTASLNSESLYITFRHATFNPSSFNKYWHLCPETCLLFVGVCKLTRESKRLSQPSAEIAEKRARPSPIDFGWFWSPKHPKPSPLTPSFFGPSEARIIWHDNAGTLMPSLAGKITALEEGSNTSACKSDRYCTGSILWSILWRIKPY